MLSDSWFDDVADAGNQYIKEQKEIELMLLRVKDPDLGGFDYDLRTYQRIMAAFRAGAEWQYNKEKNKKSND